MELKDKIKAVLEKKNCRIYACEKSLMLFSIYYFAKYHFFKIPEFHKNWYKDLLFPNITGIMLITFRESAKTSIAKIKLIHSICYSKKNFIIWTSFDQQKAEANLYDIALELQTNKKIIADFGNLFYEDKSLEKFTKKKSIGEFITTNKIKVKAYSTGQSPRGEVYGANRPDLIFLDDIETLKTIDSEPMTSQVKKYVNELFAGLSGNANLIILGNRLSNRGSISYIENKIKDDERFKIYDIPVIQNNKIVWDDKYVLTDADAQEINKDIKDETKQKISLETKKKLLGYQAYNREMLNTPITEDEQEFKQHWFISRKQEDIRILQTRNFLTIDTAISKKASADYTGICKNYVDKENKWNIKTSRLKINPKELIDLLFTFYEQDNFEKIGIEKTIYLDAIKPFLDDEMRKRNKFLPIVELLHNQVNKETRIRGLIPRYESGSIIHIENENIELENELLTFPVGATDDIVDALQYQSQVAEAPEIGIEETLEIAQTRQRILRNNNELL